MRRVRLGFVFIAIVALPALGFAQWLRYPTADVPKKSDGTPDLTAPTPRLPDGKPDFSGLWHAANPNRCVPGTSRFVECGVEIGGAPLRRNPAPDLPCALPLPPEGA